MTSFTLDKLKYITKIDINTPNCVLFEVGQNRSVGVREESLTSVTYRVKVIRLIESSKAVTVTSPFNSSTYAELAAFLNPSESEKWSATSLTDTFKHMWSKYWDTQPSLSTVSDTVKVGYPSPTNRDILTPTVAYTIVRSMGVTTSPSTSPEAMRQIIEAARMEKSHVLKKIQLELPFFSSSLLLTLVGVLADSKTKETVPLKMTDIATSINKFANKKHVGKGYIPKSNEDAVAAAISFYAKDISPSSDPMREYATLVLNQDRYDSEMRDYELIDPNIFNTRQSFNPLLPCNAYSMASLRAMLNAEAIEMDHKPDLYKCFSKLALKRCVKRFYPGVMYKVNSFETAIDNEDIREYDGPVVSYGSTKTGYDVHSVSELARMFESNGHFVNPRKVDDDIDYFDRDAIAGLVKICNSAMNKVPHKDWSSLLKVIRVINRNLPTIRDCAKPLIQVYNAASESEKTSIKNLLYYVLYSGLRMRDWDEFSINWPIKHAPIKDTDKTAELSAQYLSHVLDMRNAMGKLGTFVLSLPLIFIAKGETYVVIDAERGLTIQGRIDIVLGDRSTHGCTQLSSNFFLITAHHYLTALGERLPFQPEDVAIIG